MKKLYEVMKTKLFIVFVAFAAVFLVGCSKKESLNVAFVGLGGDARAKSELDQWLYTNFTKPYNIEVKYKWDRSELEETYKTVAPIKEELVKPVMEVVKKAWIEPYIAVKGEKFFKKYCQKQFYLTGSPLYEDRYITLGIAEGGRKIILFNLNTFDKNDMPRVKRILHTMHHEFAHILNQNIAVTPDYQRITSSDYTLTWYNIDENDYDNIYSKGFITNYSRANKDEDFVEMQSMLLTYGQTYFDNIIDNLFIYDATYIKRNYRGTYEKNTDARNKLLKKKAIVSLYLKDSWGINLADLQAKTQEAIEALSSPMPDFHTILGSDKVYKRIIINPQKLTGLSAKFLTAFNTANKALIEGEYVGSDKKKDNGSAYIDEISLIFDVAEAMTLRMKCFNPQFPVVNGSYIADFKFTVSKSNDGRLITLKYVDPQPASTPPAYAQNAANIKKKVSELLKYFDNKQFNICWVDDIKPQSKGIYGGFVKAEDPGYYLFGTLK